MRSNQTYYALARPDIIIPGGESFDVSSLTIAKLKGVGITHLAYFINFKLKYIIH